jgi:hypothetical protein
VDPQSRRTHLSREFSVRRAVLPFSFPVSNPHISYKLGMFGRSASGTKRNGAQAEQAAVPQHRPTQRTDKCSSKTQSASM